MWQTTQNSQLSGQPMNMRTSTFQALYEGGNEDAAFVADFEETIVETVQESPELASCYHTYLEARTRLKERAKYRGFWGVQTNFKGKSKKGKGAGGKGPS